MKISIKTLISATLCTIVLFSTAATRSYAVQETHSARRISLPKFKKITVTGNVDVLLVQNKKTGVIVNEARHHALLKVTQKGELLTIASACAERIQVTVYVDDIFRIDASDNASVKTYNHLNLKYLQVFLHQNAKADINAHTESLYTVIADKAQLSLSGTSSHHAMVMSKLAMLTVKDFKSLKSELTYPEEIAMIKRF